MLEYLIFKIKYLKNKSRLQIAALPLHSEGVMTLVLFKCFQ